MLVIGPRAAGPVTFLYRSRFLYTFLGLGCDFFASAVVRLVLPGPLAETAGISCVELRFISSASLVTLSAMSDLLLLEFSEVVSESTFSSVLRASSKAE